MPTPLVQYSSNEAGTTNKNVGFVLLIFYRLRATFWNSSYDAWGRMRGPDTWTYTGQELLSDFNIINLNGRLYDPLIARMMSTDPFVTDKYNVQTYNAYSYAYNNPLKYSDPTGNIGGADDAAAMIIGGCLNVALHWNQIKTPGQFASAFLWGAAAGEITYYTGGAAWGAMTAAGLTGSTVGAIAAVGTSGAVGAAFSSPVTGAGNSIVFNEPYTIGNWGRDIGAGFITGVIFKSVGTLFTKSAFTIPKTDIAPLEAVGTGMPTPIKESHVSMLNSDARVVGGIEEKSIAFTVQANEQTEYVIVGAKVHGNSLQSQKPTWGYKLFSEDGAFLKNGITSKAIPEKRYTTKFMEDKYMDAIQFSKRLDAYQWEYEQNQIQRGPLNLNMH